jgi:putative spermidine/putrescine transport system permease protein
VNTSLVSARQRFVPLIAAGLLLGVPIVVGVGYLIAGAVSGAGHSDESTLARVVRDGAVWRSALLSLWIAGAGTLLALIGAVLVALLMGGDSPVERAARTIVALPLPVPNVAAAVAVLLLLSQSGWLARVAAQLHLIAGPSQFPAMVYDPLAIGVIVTVVWKELPFLALIALSLQSLRGRALTDAARTLGATPWQAARMVTLPQLLRGMAPSIVAVFVFVLGSLELPLVLAPSSPLALPMLVQERRQALAAASHSEAYVIALLATLLALIAVLAHEALRSDER